ncbi:MAG: amidohydrolase family protein [Halapricum sp.]
MSRQNELTAVPQETTVIDADVHVSRGISAEEMADYLDEPHKSRVLQEYCYPATKGADWDPYLGGDIVERRLDGPETVEQTLQEKFGIDYPILNPMMGLARLPDSNLAVELMRARNDIFLDKFIDGTDFPGLALITTQKPDKAAEEIDRMANEDQIVGLFVESTGPHPPLGDPSYDVLYQAAEDNGLNIAYHAAAGYNFKYDFPLQNRGFEQFLEIHSLAHLWSQSETLTSLIVQGVPEKFPDLKFTFLEAGISWVPYMMWRLNKEYSIRKREAPLLERSPEEYIRDQFYFASQPLGEPNHPNQMGKMIDIIGAESLMFATDYPHWDFDNPRELDKHLRATYSEAEREQVLSRTAKEAFDLDI